MGDRRGADLISRIGDFFAVEDGEAVDLLDDVADVERRRRRAAVDDGTAMCPQVIRRDLREKPLAPGRQELALEDRPAHGPRAVSHRRHGQPLLTELAEAPRLEKPPLGALLFKGGRAPLPDYALGVDAELARPRQRDAGLVVPTQHDGLAPPVQTVVQAERHRSRRAHQHIHTVTVGDLVRFLLWFQVLKRHVRQHLRTPLDPQYRQPFLGRRSGDNQRYFNRLVTKNTVNGHLDGDGSGRSRTWQRYRAPSGGPSAPILAGR